MNMIPIIIMLAAIGCAILGTVAGMTAYKIGKHGAEYLLDDSDSE